MLDQERLTNQDMESLGEEILKEKQSLERELHALRVEKDRQVTNAHSFFLTFFADSHLLV